MDDVLRYVFAAKIDNPADTAHMIPSGYAAKMQN
jgi:hypothetical protein